jgi:hypothetical protein
MSDNPEVNSRAAAGWWVQEDDVVSFDREAMRLRDTWIGTLAMSLASYVLGRQEGLVSLLSIALVIVALLGCSLAVVSGVLWTDQRQVNRKHLRTIRTPDVEFEKLQNRWFDRFIYWLIGLTAITLLWWIIPAFVVGIAWLYVLLKTIGAAFRWAWIARFG